MLRLAVLWACVALVSNLIILTKGSHDEALSLPPDDGFVRDVEDKPEHAKDQEKALPLIVQSEEIPAADHSNAKAEQEGGEDKVETEGEDSETEENERELLDLEVARRAKEVKKAGVFFLLSLLHLVLTFGQIVLFSWATLGHTLPDIEKIVTAKDWHSLFHAVGEYRDRHMAILHVEIRATFLSVVMLVSIAVFFAMGIKFVRRSVALVYVLSKRRSLMKKEKNFEEQKLASDVEDEVFVDENPN
ncbi:hypothetical protein Emed_006770 [Eimeria media]